MPTVRELRAQYGDVPITRSRGFALVHLDAPTDACIRERTRAFDPENFFEPDCPLCAIQRSRRVVVFDDFTSSDSDPEQIVLDEG